MRVTASDLTAKGGMQVHHTGALGHPVGIQIGCKSTGRLRDRYSMLDVRDKPENISSTPSFYAARVRHQARPRLTVKDRRWRFMEKNKNDQAYANRFQPCGRNPRGGNGRKPT